MILSSLIESCCSGKRGDEGKGQSGDTLKARQNNHKQH